MKSAFLLSLLLIVAVSAVKIIPADWSAALVNDTVHAGEIYQLSLKSNPTTGFRWELKSRPLFSDYTGADNYGEFIEPASGAEGAP